MSSDAPRGDASDTVVAVIPAAGSGSRFDGATSARGPKQYADLAGASLLERSVRRMLDVPDVDRVVVALAAGDARFGGLDVAADPRVVTVEGGATRSASVAAALLRVRREQGDRAWALVHDAARPLVDAGDVRALLDAVREADASGRAVGGILAVRVADTLKREASGETRGEARGEAREEVGDGASGVPGIGTTVSRDGLWQAQTPQLFRAGPLADALARAHGPGADAAPTDEASVMEGAGTVLLVEARSPNPKITRPVDLALARALLAVGASAGDDVGSDGGRRSCA